MESFRLPSADLPLDGLARFYRGRGLFETDMVRQLTQEKGVEPRFRNGNGCSDCHLGGGRNAVREESERAFPFAPIVVRPPPPSGRPTAPDDAPMAADAASFAQAARISWHATQRLIDGHEYSLIYPRVTMNGAVVAAARIRITPSLIGLGLLEQISDDDILAWYRNHRLGRVPQVKNSATPGGMGRFGLEATSASILDFVGTALHDELGIVDQSALNKAQVEDLAYYASELGVPRRQMENSQVDAGYAIFQVLGCSNCHRPSYEIHRQNGTGSVAMTIWPFSDLLVHDLSYPGSGGGHEFWRTTPLWGLGRVETTLGYGAYMHDGRGRTLEEAILWHGGEAALSRFLFVESTDDARSALLAFLRSL
jgi:CxxC motif-containing protein (DUF1111 family)